MIEHTLVLSLAIHITAGNVGIGTTNPGATLHVNGDAKARRIYSNIQNLTVNSTGNTNIIAGNSNNGYSGYSTTILITAVNSSFSGGDIPSVTAIVAWNGFPSYSNVMTLASNYGTGNVNFVRDGGYGVALYVSGSSYYGTWVVSILQLT